MSGIRESGNRFECGVNNTRRKHNHTTRSAGVPGSLLKKITKVVDKVYPLI